MYLTYDEYLEYGGEMEEEAFAAAELRARKRIDWLTDGRVESLAAAGELPEAVKLAMMSAIRIDAAVGADAQAESPLVASFDTDGYSETYGDAAARTQAVERQLASELKRLLAGVTDARGVPVLYRGVEAGRWA